MTMAPQRTTEMQLEELTAKVDRLTLMLEEERAARTNLADLVSEGAPMARAAFQQVALTLDERRVDVGEIAEMGLRLAEAAPDLNRALQSFQALASLLDDVGGLAGEGYDMLAARLEEMDRRGYFTWAKGGFEVIDRIITSFDEGDIRALGDNVVLIFETVKEMTQPEVMRMLQRSARMMREDVEVPKKLSLFRLLRELRDPEVKLAIYRTLTMLKGMSPDAEQADSTHTTEKEE